MHIRDMNSVIHFTHPDHYLTPAGGIINYTCFRCKQNGGGQRYCCTVCPNFQLHPFCATCPKTISFFMHPDHPLEYAPPYDANHSPVICNVCGYTVDGTHYECCGFHAHPNCVQLPRTINGAPCHPRHPISFVWYFEATTCQVCRGVCQGWRFRCDSRCRFDFHLMCIGGIHNDPQQSIQARGLRNWCFPMLSLVSWVCVQLSFLYYCYVMYLHFI